MRKKKNKKEAEGAYQGDEGGKYIIKTAATPKDLRITLG